MVIAIEVGVFEYTYFFYFGEMHMKESVNDFSKVTAILRGYNKEQVFSVIDALVGSSIRAVEITLNRKDSKEIVAEAVKKYGDLLSIGAGTVLSKEDLEDVIRVGVDFVLAPNLFTKEMLEYCKEHNVISVPGAFSPTEIHQAFSDGADIVKVFPASRIGSAYFKDIKAPFGDLPLMAVGGINGYNIREYLMAGARFVGIASGLFKHEDILHKDLQSLKQSIKKFESQMEGV